MNLAIRYLKNALPYSLKKGLLDVFRPQREGIGPVLRTMDREMKKVFDIGANVGDVSLYMLHYFPEADVYSFEPCTETYAQLTKNIAKAGFSKRLHSFRLGFFDVETEGKLNIASFHGANSMLDFTDEYCRSNPRLSNVMTEQIPLVRLDDFVTQNRIEHIDLVKIDVEGVELQVLLGGAETFSTKVDFVIMEISFVRHSAETREYLRIFQLMHDYGFIPCKIYDVAQAGEGEMRLAQLDCVFRKY
ncbi:MAG: FkbM family methyltransferase [Geobacteraceae bacterium]